MNQIINEFLGSIVMFLPDISGYFQVFPDISRDFHHHFHNHPELICGFLDRNPVEAEPPGTTPGTGDEDGET